MARTKSLNFICFIFNILNVVLVSVCVYYFFAIGGTGNMEVQGVKCFKFFTVDSNILMALFSIPVMIYEITNVIYSKNRMPKAVIVLKYIGTVAVMVTFLTTALFLPQFYDIKFLFEGINFYLHLICPLFAFISLLVETQEEIKTRSIIFGTLPVIIYGAIYIYMVKFSQEWEDFYGFDSEGYGYLSYVIMILLTLLLSFLILKLHKITKEKLIQYK